MGSLVIGLQRFKLKTVEQAGMIVRKIVLDLHTRVVMRSPVDTGRFRANNSVSLNDMPGDSVLTFDKDGRVTISRGQQVMASFKLGDTIFIYNNVEYGMALEYGHSQQAPQGVYRLSAMEVVAHLGAAA